MSTFRTRSKEDWNGDTQIEHINAGSLQRIADATEKMAANHDALVRAKKSAEDSRDYWQKTADKLQRRVNGLRGHINRIKRREKEFA